MSENKIEILCSNLNCFKCKRIIAYFEKIIKENNIKELLRNKMYNLDAVVLPFNNLKNPRIVVLFKDFFKEDKGKTTSVKV